ncbi:hypothetical protein AVEN_6227-1 [Araneus ventricosus]|uniref:Uncharacterized protein n=1 Tax=Araneus ventricosus TaxID=182803 RepID=A0A4Y2GPV2_ARAVE|nr:hypothetical protein AVEN_6227-1 [Araneus ventricosus]
MANFMLVCLEPGHLITFQLSLRPKSAVEYPVSITTATGMPGVWGFSCGGRTVRTSFGRIRAVDGDVYKDSGLSTRAIAAAIIQRLRVLRQGGSSTVCGYEPNT